MADDLRTIALRLAETAAELAAALPGSEHAVKALDLPGDADAGCAVFKAVEESRYTLGLAYPALKPDVGKAMDGFRDFAGPEVVEKAAWGYARDHRQIGLMHADGTEGAGEVVESYIYRGPDWCMKGVDGTDVTVVAGDWLLGVQWSPDAWTAIKSGEVKGYSFHGKARRSLPTEGRLAELRG